MKTINIADKLIPNKPTSYSFLRILTGIIILLRAFIFIFVTANLQSIIKADITVFAENSSALSTIISILNIACGLFILVGFVTRISAIIQIPILLVAVFIVNIKHIGENPTEFILSLITLVLLFIVAYKGSGPFSADEYFRRGAALDKNNEGNS
ncbi:DoxX family protein [Parafilimonas sp.]|uniref:DoxX family protein n=1 Tax=Parafilimonas sp. TaxID=1969739 RepID=UPI003F8014DB